MSASYADVVRLNSEAALWEALGRALSHSEERAPFQPDFLEATWAKIHIVYEGRQFHSSLTPSAMKGIVEMQSALYRAAAQLLHDEASIISRSPCHRPARPADGCGPAHLASARYQGARVLQAFEILQECRELWAEPREWRRHLLRRLAALTHCRLAFCIEVSEQSGRIGEQLLFGEDVGWNSDSERNMLLTGLTVVL